MKPTQEQLQQFIGGQAEIQNEFEEYLFRGEIATISIEGDDLKIHFKWLAKGEGFPPIPKRWVNEDNHEHQVSLMICSVSDIGPSGGEVGGGNRLCLNSPITHETTTLYPPDGSKLDPAKVEGLKIEESDQAAIATEAMPRVLAVFVELFGWDAVSDALQQLKGK